MAEKDDEIQTVKQNGINVVENVQVPGLGSGDSAVAAVPNGVRPGLLVVCPEMCCYCFDVLIAHLTNNHHGSRNPFLKFFKNDE